MAQPTPNLLTMTSGAQAYSPFTSTCFHKQRHFMQRPFALAAQQKASALTQKDMLSMPCWFTLAPQGQT